MKKILIFILCLVPTIINGQIYPSPKQLLAFYNASEQAVKDSLIAHGYKHVMTFANTSKNGYRRYVYTKNCKIQHAISNDWIRRYEASLDSPKEGIIFEFCSYNKIVKDPSIEFLDLNTIEDYYQSCIKLGYKNRYKILNYPRYSDANIGNLNLYKEASKRLIKGLNYGKPGLFPLAGKLFFDSYHIPNHSVSGDVKSYIIGVRMSGDPSRFWYDSLYEGDKVLWDRDDETNEREDDNIVSGFSSEFLNRKISEAKSKLPQKSEIVAILTDNDCHHIVYKVEETESSSYSDRIVITPNLYVVDFIGRGVEPQKITSSDKSMEVIKCPDNKHLIVLGYYKNEGGRYYLQLVDTKTFEAEEIASWEKISEFNKSANGYIINNEYQTIIIDKNGKIIHTIDK